LRFLTPSSIYVSNILHKKGFAVDLLAALDRTFQHARTVVADVRPEQYDEPTPCEAWTVRDLLAHMIGVVAGIGAAAAGTPPTAPFELSPDPAAQLERAAAASLEAWRAPGVLDRIVDAGAGPMPGRVLAGINLLDTATHTWDLAVATGRKPVALPEDVATAALDVSLQTITPELRPGRFDPEITPGPDADATERLVAFLGRTS
jgi:uncharacterized protein (TIGR03086 family)